MRKHITSLFLIILPFIIQAQVHNITEAYINRRMSFSDSVKISHTPALDVPEMYSKGLLSFPQTIDNSTKPYFRPITWQSGYECGQTTGIGFVFTFEIDRLRDLNASLPQNQYHTHFAWNFLNDAYNYTGVSFFDSWEITRLCGTPTIAEYGPLYGVNEKYWMSGYTKYYNAMKNRTSGVYSIRCDSEEGINTLKGWLYDHLEGSATGGICAFYGQYCSPNATLPSGTPEAGKDLIASWGSSPSHAWTIVGYNDSIRYDYNNDNQYTNDIDLNGDGIINVRDWEIGGVKIANGYAGTGWGDNGFSYVMYKSLADGNTNGGIWNATAYVIKVKETQDPRLTMKIGLKHNVRNQIKVMVGVSQNTAATVPDIRMEYPIFNYQGSTLYMQGDTTEASKSIEFGLDITPLLSYIQSGQQAKFFLEVIEDDPSGTGTGQINNFSLMDYTMGGLETSYPNSNIPLQNNDTTRLAINKIITFSSPQITTDSLIAQINEPYTAQLNAQSGTQPYEWRLKMDFDESVNNQTFPAAGSQVLSTGNSSYVIQNLPFSFPFFGNSYDKIYIYADGFVKVDNSTYSFPYLIDADLLFRSHKMIAPFHADLTYTTGYNVTYEAGLHSATIVWKARISGQSSSNVNVALKIYETGLIEFYYGNINMTGSWFSALSGGDVVNYQYTSLSNNFTNNTTAQKVTLTPPDYPAQMSFDESGQFKATPNREHNTYIKFSATDNNNITQIKSVLFKTFGLMATYTIDAGGDSIVHAGDTVLVSVKIKNSGASLPSSTHMLFTTADTNAIMLDSTAQVGVIANGDSLIINNAFSFAAKNSASDGHFIELTGLVMTPTDTFTSGLSLRVNTFLIATGNVTISDGNNNILEPNETAALMLEIKNIGGATATNLTFHLSTGDPYITLNPGTANIDTLMPNSSKNAFFIITTAANTPADHLIVLNVLITGNNNYSFNTFFFIQMGNVMEDFETADFTKYDWTHSGTTDWIVTDSIPYQGIYAARSGDINDNETSSLIINQYVLTDGYLRFHRKVSCERDNTNHNWDYLAFYIDGAEMARWDGEMDWEQISYPIQAGNHTFKWSYVKDYSVSNGSDCGWIDNVMFPISGDATPEITYTPTAVYKTIEQNTIDTAMVSLNNIGNGLVLFTDNLQLLNGNAVPWASLNTIAGGLNTNQPQNIVITFDGNQLQPGNYDCRLLISENFTNDTIIPVYLTVTYQSGTEEHSPFAASCFPNPFNDKVNIALMLKENGTPCIEIFDFTGRRVTTVSDKNLLASGPYSFEWNGTNSQGQTLPEGIYLCKISFNNTISTFKLVLTR